MKLQQLSYYYLYRLVFLCCIERRARLVRKVAVPTYLGVWVQPPQVFQKIDERCPLCQCSRVLRRLAVRSAAANIAHTDAVCIMPCAMSTCNIDVTALNYCAVTINDVVITDVSKATRLVPCSNVLNGEVFPLWCRRAMYYYLGDCPR